LLGLLGSRIELLGISWISFRKNRRVLKGSFYFGLKCLGFL
jgi:hypothetical protein